MLLPIWGYFVMLEENYFETKKLGKKSKILMWIEIISLVLIIIFGIL